MSKRQDYQQLVDAIKKDGKVFIGFIHQFYGPLRSLNFIITDPNPEYVVEYIETQKRWESIVVAIWEKTGLATTPMVLPWDMLKECEEPPLTFNTFKMAEAHLKSKMQSNPGLDKDPYFYRLGKI